MRYGKEVTITANGGTLDYAVKQYSDFETIKDYVVHTEQLRIKSEKEILATFLTLLDKQKAGEIQEIGLKCIPDPQGNITRVEKSWVTRNLR